VRAICKAIVVLLAAMGAAVSGEGCRPGERTRAKLYEYPPTSVRRKPRPGDNVRWLAPEEAQRELREDSDVFLLCVDTKEQYDRGHIAGSVLIPVMGLKAGLEKNDFYPEINGGRVPRKDQRIICYCWWKPCICPVVPTFSELAGKILLKQGYKKVLLIDGGMRAWIESDLPLAKSKNDRQP
jgi:rhodanese-related sulfurtransferase